MSSRVCTTRIPRPPPPADAFTMMGNPTELEMSRASLSLRTGPSLPGTTGTPAAFRVDRHRADAQFTARPDDPNGDLAPICDEEFAKHGLSVHRNYVYLVYLVYSVSLVLLPTPTKCW